MNLLISEEELEIQWTLADFVLKTQRQIAKDFAASGFDFNTDFITNELSKDEIIDAIGSQLENVMKLGETTLLQLLYQIDVPQSTFLGLVGNEEFLLEMSEIILRREAYKVYLRSKF